MAIRLKEQGKGNFFRLRSDVIGNYIDFNGWRMYQVDTAVEAGITTTTVGAVTAPDGSLLKTTHATGGTSLFIAQAGVWEAIAVAA